MLLATLVTLAAGGLQIAYGLLGGGTLIKYIPYPVVTGYLSGVGVVILLKQLPALFGISTSHGLLDPGLWSGPSLIVGLSTISAMFLAPRITKAVPGAIVGLATGVAVYFLLGLARPELLQLAGNPLLIGPLPAGSSPLASLSRFAAFSQLRAADLALLLGPALTLSVLLSIDTLKTCVVVDALTRTRHESNREVVGQGLANLTSALLGGMPGAGTSGATLVNVASGARTRFSGVLEGIFALVAFLALGGLVAWAPRAALAGILVVVGLRMLDLKSLDLARQRSTLLDFVVVASVVVVAVGVGLIEASATGVALAILLFLREQVRGTVIHRKVHGDHVASRQRRLPEAMEVLSKEGTQTVVCELEGSLFFGTTDQLRTQLAPDLTSCRYLVLDLRRVRSVDLTAVHLLQQMQEQLAERDAWLLLCDVPRNLPSGQDLRAYLHEVGLAKESRLRVFNQLSDALEWVEDRILERAGWAGPEEERPLELREIDFLRGRKQETVEELATIVEQRHLEAGQVAFRQGDVSDEILFIRRGSVRIVLRIPDGGEYHVATVGRGDFFGDMAFLDRGARSADAVAEVPTDLFVLSRARFDEISDRHPNTGRQLLGDLARVLALRLRHADGEIRALEEA
jgi:SulP family sulfate permease